MEGLKVLLKDPSLEARSQGPYMNARPGSSNSNHLRLGLEMD
jgi:hypothetical protein